MEEAFLEIKRKYQSSNHKLDGEKIITLIEVFEKLYYARTTQNQETYYLGNLIQTGLLEGTRDEILGTVPDAIERTKKFFNDYLKRDELGSHQAAMILDNVINIIRKESFSQPVDTILQGEMEAIKDMQNGLI